MNIMHQYMVKGILDSGIVEDGGAKCYAEIPKAYHVIVGVISVFIHFTISKKWAPHLVNPHIQYSIKPNVVEKIFAIFGIVSLVLTFYFKLITGKGIFIFNPCHVALLLTVILLLLPTSQSTTQLHAAWTAWLYGAMLALGIPHLYGVTQFEVYLYYFEHVLIIPIGPWLLYRRYKLLRPNFKNQMASFGSMVIYQVGVLLPLCLITTVNLNFALCHSPADPAYPYIGYHYFPAAVIVLNVISFVGRWITYLLILPIELYYNYIRPRVDSHPTCQTKPSIIPQHKN